MHFLDLPDMWNRKRSADESSSGMWSDIPSEAVIESRIIYGRKRHAFYGFFMEYSKKTSIHGLHYLCQQRRPIYERLYWVMFFIIAIVSCVYSIRSVYNRWKNFPLIISFDTEAMPVYEIPFPSIVICPQFKTNSRVFNFTDVYKRVQSENASSEELDILSALLHVCNPPEMDKVISILEKYELNDTSIDSKLQSVMMRHNDTGIICVWDNEFYRCEDIQRYVATDEGICYQFNGVDLVNLYRNESFFDGELFQADYHFENTIDGVKMNLAVNSSEARQFSMDGDLDDFSKLYPKRTIWSGVGRGYINCLEVHSDDFDYLCQDGMQGHKIALLSPEEVPAIIDNFIFLPNNREVVISVTPQYIVPSKNIEKYDPYTRNCFFDHERYLKFFNKYNQRNCEFECLTNFTISKCGCTTFYMPRVEGVPVCGVSNITCYTDARHQMQHQIYKDTMTKKTLQCNCLPCCTSLKFNFEISEAKFDLKGTFGAFMEWARPDITGSRFTVYFKEKQFTAIVQTEHYGISGLIAYIGGTFGLFMGFSLLSLVELIYFISIRLYFNMKQRQMKTRTRKLFKQFSMEAEHPKKF